MMKVKTHIPEERKRSVVYEVPCKECHRTQIGETKRTLKVRLGEHKRAVKRGDPNNGITVNTHECNHAVDWDAAEVTRSVSGYQQRRMTKGDHSLDSDIQLPIMWYHILNPP